MPNKEPKRYYTTTEAAALCGMSQATILRAISAKQLRAGTTPGGHFRILEEDLEDFMRANNIVSSKQPARPWRVLIVEDNPAELRMFARALEGEPNMEIKTTTSGFEAGLLLRSFRPDLILLDIMIEHIDGRQVALLIRSNPDLQGTKIAAITGYQDEKTLREIKACGVDDLLLKPVPAAELRRRVGALLT